MSVRIAWLAWALAIAAATPAAEVRAQQANTEAVRAAMSWGSGMARELTVPESARLANEARALATSIATLCDDQTPKTLADAQAAWIAAATTLRRLAALPIGPTLTRRTLRRIDFWPTRPGDIEAAILRFEAEPHTWSRIGTPAQGLPALEYLLFPSRGTKPPTADAARCAYASKLAETVAAESGALAAEWQAWLAASARRESSSEADRQAAMDFLNDGVNALVGVLEQLRNKHLARPLARGGREPAFDAWRSGRSRTMLAATYDGITIVIAGKGSAGGLAGALRANGQSKLAARLESELARTAPLIAAVPEVVVAGSEGMRPTPAAAASVTRAAEGLGRLQALIADDVASAFAIPIGFNETDGD